MRSKIYLACIVFVVASLSGSLGLALDPMGPPAAKLKQGQFAAGAEYSYSEMDIKTDTPRVTILGVPVAGLLSSGTMKDVRSNRFYANFGVGLMDDVELFVRLGAADARPDASTVVNDVGDLLGDSQYGFAVGAGAKATLWKNEDNTLKLGALAQVSWTRFMFDDPIMMLSQDTDISFFEIQLAVGPTYSPMEGVSIYGGPFFHFIDGHLELTASMLGTPVATLSANLEQDSVFGGFVGGEIDFTENLSLRAEYQFTAGAWAVTTGISWAF